MSSDSTARLMNMSAAAMGNPVILSKIMKNMDTKQPILDQLQLRLVSKSFNSSVLSLIRLNHRTVTVTPEHEEVFDEDGEEIMDSFRVNRQNVRPYQAPRFFQFLNFVAGIRIRSLTFADFLKANEEVHDVVMLDLIGSKEHPIEEFHGAADMCEKGCESCHLVAKNCKKYGPMQCYFPLKTLKHFEKMQVDEVWLYQVAKFCTAKQTEAAFEAAIRRRISRLITCDHLEFIFSTKYFGSDEAVTFSRRLIDEMTVIWKVKRVTVTFMNYYSRGFNFRDAYGNGSKYPLEPFGFQQSSDSVTKSRYCIPYKPISFELVEINLHDAVPFDDEFYSDLSASCPVSKFQNLISVVQKLFPTTKIYVNMPSRFSEGTFNQIVSTFLRFSWCQDNEFLFRGTNMFVRFQIVDRRIEGPDFEDLRQIMKQYEFSADVEPCTQKILQEFEKWSIPSPALLDELTLTRSAITLMDESNRRNMHLELLME